MPTTCDRLKVIDFKQERGYTSQRRDKIYAGSLFDKWNTSLSLQILILGLWHPFLVCQRNASRFYTIQLGFL